MNAYRDKQIARKDKQTVWEKVRKINGQLSMIDKQIAKG